MLTEIFAQRIKELRLSKNLKQDDIAEILDVSKAQISDIERGRRTTTLEKLIILANHFDCSVDYLLGRTDNPNSHKL